MVDDASGSVHRGAFAVDVLVAVAATTRRLLRRTFCPVHVMAQPTAGRRRGSRCQAAPAAAAAGAGQAGMQGRFLWHFGSDRHLLV
jgi:predicted amidophosphoribosyltransferase